MIVREIRAKSILSPSKIYSYVINPYAGCQHACSYCYARFMKKFTGHKEPWGEFVDVKINAPELLRAEIFKKKKDTVWVSGVCDPYQPLEKKYGLSRSCLAILADNAWPIVIQTRSPLILRDMDILKRAPDLKAGFSVTTGDDSVRVIFEPLAPSIEERINALDELHRAGIRTYAMAAPMLPGVEKLPELLKGKIDYLLVDRMNYDYADRLYREHGFEKQMTDGYFDLTSRRLSERCAALGIDCRIVF